MNDHSYRNAKLLAHLWSLIPGALLCVSLFAEEYDPGRFEKEIIIPSCNDPMQCEVAADGRLFFVERAGALKLAEPSGGVASGHRVQRPWSYSGRGNAGDCAGDEYGIP